MQSLFKSQSKEEFIWFQIAASQIYMCQEGHLSSVSAALWGLFSLWSTHDGRIMLKCTTKTFNAWSENLLFSVSGKIVTYVCTETSFSIASKDTKNPIDDDLITHFWGLMHLSYHSRRSPHVEAVWYLLTSTLFSLFSPYLWMRLCLTVWWVFL